MAEDERRERALVILRYLTEKYGQRVWAVSQAPYTEGRQGYGVDFSQNWLEEMPAHEYQWLRSACFYDSEASYAMERGTVYVTFLHEDLRPVTQDYPVVML